MKTSKNKHDKELEYKKFLFIMKRNNVVFEIREHEAYGRDYARHWADQVEISENCKITVKIKKDEK